MGSNRDRIDSEETSGYGGLFMIRDACIMTKEEYAVCRGEKESPSSSDDITAGVRSMAHSVHHDQSRTLRSIAAWTWCQRALPGVLLLRESDSGSFSLG